MCNAETTIYDTRADYIAALIDDVEQIVAEEIPGCGRAHRRRARKIGEEFAKRGITPALWESFLKGNAAGQEEAAIDFLHKARRGLGEAMEEMRLK